MLISIHSSPDSSLEKKCISPIYRAVNELVGKKIVKFSDYCAMITTKALFGYSFIISQICNALLLILSVLNHL